MKFILSRTTVVFYLLVTIAAAEVPQGPPDLTQNREVDRERTYNLGATGLRGWIYTKPATYLDSVQGRTTTASRQILVTHVGNNSPADGVMRVDDVILGAGGTLFSDDARKSIARSIQEAEKAENHGILKLTVWRTGKLEQVQLKLRVLGTYGATPPYDSPKSNRILDEACKVLVEENPGEDIWKAVNGLALLATGRSEYLPKAQELARELGPPTLNLTRKAFGSWETGYRDLFLCEYYLLTGDQEVLHAIRQHTLALARGQSMYGTFGHGFAEPKTDEDSHGSIPPYGPVNAAGLVCNIAIVMGRKCGVDDPEVDAAIERASNFFGCYVDKGTIPYGEHEPWPYHENNGKSAMAAIFFALQGDKIPETHYFAKMCVASFKNREYGHTGQGFSYLWGALGANTGGPAALAAFFKEASWHFDLVRRCDGSFTYDGGEQYGAGKTDDGTYYGNSGYYGLSPTAVYVLTYALPLRKLYITGKNAQRANRLSDEDVAQAVASGHFDLKRKDMSNEQLMEAFDDWSPVVRGWAAEELATRPDVKALVPRLMALAEGPNGHVAQGACEALGHIKDPHALPVFIRLLSHNDRWLRFKAANALKEMGGEARPVVGAMLEAVAKTAEPTEPVDWHDPLQLPQGQLGKALFDGPLTSDLPETERELLYPAVRTIAHNPDGMARATLRGFFERRLTLEDVQALGPDILTAVMSRAPADTMFGNEIRMGGFKALTKYHFREGIAAGVAFARTQGGHGSESRTGEIMQEIATYGSAAQKVVPELRTLIDYFNAECEAGRFPKGEGAPARSSLCVARQRLGSEPLVELHRLVVRPMATEQTPGAFYHGMRKVGIDGTVLDVPDCDTHQHLGRSSGSRGEGPFPQVRKVSLVELGTHIEFAFVYGGWHDSEKKLVEDLWDMIPENALLIEDRGFFSYESWKTLHHKHKLLVRVCKSMVFKPFKQLSDGSYLAKIYPRSYDRDKDRRGIVVRVIEYKLNDPQRTGHDEVHRLMTNLLDAEQYPAMELILEYHERWEEELVFDEQKTHQDPCRAEKTTNLRSETSDGLRQELYALSLGHFVTRAMMLQAAETTKTDVDRLSFKGCFQILKTRLPECHAATETSFAEWFEAVIWEMSCETIPIRRNRINPRVIKRKMSRWNKCRPEHRKQPPLKKAFEETVVMKL